MGNIVANGVASTPPPVLTFQDAADAIKRGQKTNFEAAQALLSQLSTKERLSLLDGDDAFYPGLRIILLDRYNREPFVMGAVPRLGIPGIRFSDGPRGVVMGASTAFPVSMARGATWDTSLERRVGDAIGREAKAQGANYFAGVCVNLPRHPAWGRIQETYGEDPLLLGEFGVAIIQGVQRHIMACVKHFALNSMENARFKVDVVVEEDVLHEVYLPHFRRIVEAGVASVMSSYNSVRGEFAGQNGELLNDILRHQWGFSGFVMSDFIFGLRDAVLSLENGLDIEAPFSQQRAMYLPRALESGRLDPTIIDRACVRILAKQLSFHVQTEPSLPDPSVVFSEEHRALAREVAARSMVLLKNDEVEGARLLPLDATRLSKVALVGRLSNVANTGDRGSSQVFPPEVVTPFDGLKAALPGADIILSDTDSVEDAREAAAGADVVICVVGYDASDEGEYVVPAFKSNPELKDLFPPPRTDQDKETLKIIEGGYTGPQPSTGIEVGAGGDRKSLRLRPRDIDLIKATSASNPGVIVVVITAGAVIMEEWKGLVPGLVVSWYSGSEGGCALADILLGRLDASGRLPFSIPKDESHLPFFDRLASTIQYDRWFGQALLDKLGVEAAFPLGFGLSYTTFRTSDIRVGDYHRGSGQESLSVSAQVENTGPRQGRCIVQVYGRAELPDFPKRVLLGFVPVDLAAGKKGDITITASLRPLQRWRGGVFVMPNKDVVIEVAAFSGDAGALQTTVHL
ncbi:Glycoside hydrolase family 3 protein [Pleurostoma richardsiae]|uniref:beta-glucosidase n=1 Tax=Pleurostoma richardsiae TaxID=41990 RepID=A0AA38RBS8_9PEZI|nr:Glycoside hydrolase family 3 protein [Pleurostoma richardsiae]